MAPCTAPRTATMPLERGGGSAGCSCAPDHRADAVGADEQISLRVGALPREPERDTRARASLKLVASRPRLSASVADGVEQGAVKRRTQRHDEPAAQRADTSGSSARLQHAYRPSGASPSAHARREAARHDDVGNAERSSAPPSHWARVRRPKPSSRADAARSKMRNRPAGLSAGRSPADNPPMPAPTMRAVRANRRYGFRAAGKSPSTTVRIICDGRARAVGHEAHLSAERLKNELRVRQRDERQPRPVGRHLDFQIVAVEHYLPRAERTDVVACRRSRRAPCASIFFSDALLVLDTAHEFRPILFVLEAHRSRSGRCRPGRTPAT